MILWDAKFKKNPKMSRTIKSLGNSGLLYFSHRFLWKNVIDIFRSPNNQYRYLHLGTLGIIILNVNICFFSRKVGNVFGSIIFKNLTSFQNNIFFKNILFLNFIIMRVCITTYNFNYIFQSILFWKKLKSRNKYQISIECYFLVMIL